MTDEPINKTSVSDLAKALLDSLVKNAQDNYANDPVDKIVNTLKFEASQGALNGIHALSVYAQAKAAERQATALESLAKTASKIQMSDAVDSNAQAIVDMRESRRDYLATTYSLPYSDLALLWALRGMLVDASIKSLSKPDRFDPYRRLTTEELAWSLRTSPEEFWAALPHTPEGAIDYDLLDEFGVAHYGGTDSAPDDWVFNG